MLWLEPTLYIFELGKNYSSKRNDIGLISRYVFDCEIDVVT